MELDAVKLALYLKLPSRDCRIIREISDRLDQPFASKDDQF